ncbi:hypothetical protein CPB84DRAFT_1766511 [Gymnopilus junonius]|uniref:Uncharacterized protein n=1 Tax=Gymnopilus junonius TaxID=109634 RepID=A0A9P5NWN4_GYMJU|nr:hypothetical protein CPB84DRAFT_1766511 [Gymnopilus junonius]
MATTAMTHVQSINGFYGFCTFVVQLYYFASMFFILQFWIKSALFQVLEVSIPDPIF